MSATADTDSEESPATFDGDRCRLVLVTGYSGSGKSTAAKAFEDLGFYCVDNLPLPLLRTFLADPVAQVGACHDVAVVTDVRAPGFAEVMPRLLDEIDRQYIEFRMLFLEASEQALVRRYSETRRSHPLAAGDRPLIEGIRREVDLLGELRGRADLIFDTSDWSVHDVRRAVYRQFGDEAEGGGAMGVSLVSFGYKHGIPSGSDLVVDVRFLPNPYFLPALRELTGRDPEVREYMEAQPDFHQFIDRFEDFLLFLLPRYRRENRSYLTLAVG